ncbi:hypothetical protein AOC36_04635 [Erysipelothrix larvae]|uniref:HTH lacI-type domain-containing protein n=1 Tax=Erysipelothrix larvae TaxID=1514105 RepID=A0A109UGV6_9FIRM|nr:LacI family DNA-binding transcriptional regulator [Erysipelothrix larvae]AMC93283.1 hypothetical protein AOC36_04635 [Erysipelothrix larvae]
MSKTLKEIAQIAGTSIATVSKVVNGKTLDIGEKTVQRVQEILDREGYTPNQIARNLKTNKSKTLGLLIPDIRNPFFTEIARGAEDAASDNGYTVFFCNTDDNFNKEIVYLSELSSRQIDGFIIAGSYRRRKEVESTFQVSAPMVAIDRVVNYPNIISFITTDNFKSSYSITEMMIQMGHKNFLYVGGPEESDVTQDRYHGFCAALNDFNIDHYDALFGEYSVESGYDLLLEYDKAQYVSAIVCGNDLIALGVVNALKERHIHVPGTVSVTGFDNIDFAKSISPSLTTINQPTYEMGRKAVELLMNHFDGDNIDKIVELSQDIVVRSSSRGIL